MKSKHRTSKRRQHSLRNEALEPRMMLHGGAEDSPWVAPSQLTLSFANDGVDIAGESNQLFESFNESFGGEQAWQQTILRAFQTWIQPTELDLGVVAEEGTYEFGVAGSRSGDERFGDIRIGARPLSSETVAVAINQTSIVSGTWAGDIIFNSDLPDVDTLDKLYSVALHEAGHILGIEHSDDPNSPMHIHGVSDAVSLQPSDVDEVVARYGQRSPDAYERSRGNDDIRRASVLRLHSSTGFLPGSAPSVAFANLDDTDDVDYYRIAAPFGYTGDVTIELSTNGISLLNANLTLLDANGTPLTTVNAPTADNGVVRLTTTMENAGEVRYVKVEAANDDIFSIGAYSLVVTYEGITSIEEAIVEQLKETRRRARIGQDAIESFFESERRSFRDDGRSDDSPAGANEFEFTRETQDTTTLQTLGTISEPDDIDFYRFTTSRRAESDTQQAYISIRSLDAGQLVPKITLLSDRREQLPVQVLVNGNGELLVRTDDLQWDRTFVVAVQGDGPIDQFKTGNYELSLTLTPTTTGFEQFATGSVTSGTSQTHELFVASSQLFHFALTVAGEDQRAGIRVQIVDETGQVQHEVVSPQGTTRTAGSVLLAPGSYDVVATALATTPVQSPVEFTLDGAVISEPLGLDPVEVEDTEYKCPTIESVYCYPNGNETDVPHDFSELLIFIGENNWSGGEIDQSLLVSWWNASLQVDIDASPPESTDDEFSTDTGQTLNVTAGTGVLANDPQTSDILVASLTTPPKHGSVFLNYDGSFEYTPDAGYRGVDWFEYLSTDLIRNSTPSRVTLNVGVVPLAADLDDDGVVTAADIDLYSQQLLAGGDVAEDLNTDGTTDEDDRDFLIFNLVGSTYGDANLDGVFDSSDLVQVFQLGLYEAEASPNIGWVAGDFTGDQMFDSSDLTRAFQLGYNG